MTIVTVSSLLAIAGIWILLTWAFRNYRVDRFRQGIFEVRDDLFLYAAEGHITFDHPAYTTLRTLCNGYLRSAHRLSLTSLFLLWVSLHDDHRAALEAQESFQEKWERALAGLRPEVVEQMRMCHARIDFYVSRQLIFGSPFMMALVFPIVLAYVFKEATVRIWRRFGDRVIDLDDTALVLGAS